MGDKHAGGYIDQVYKWKQIFKIVSANFDML